MPIGSGSLVLASRSVPLHVRKRRLGHSHAPSTPYQRDHSLPPRSARSTLVALS